jgi:hypothetical protein
LGPGTGADLSVTTPTLDRLTRFDTLLEGQGPSTRFQLIWQQTMEAIEAAFAALTTQVGDNSNLISQIQAALSLAAAANDNAVATASEVTLANSYINPVGVLTASNDGTVNVAAHQRIYGDGTAVTVDAGSVTGQAPGSAVTIFYADAARIGGAVSYQATAAAVPQTGNTHIVGQVLSPAVGEPPAPGSGPSAPGYTPPDPYTYDPRLINYDVSY